MIEALLAKLKGVKCVGIGRWMALCSVHKEKTASLSLQLLDDGRILVHCFGCGCGAVAAILAAGLELDEVFPPRPYDSDGCQKVKQRIAVEQALLALRDEVYFLQASQYWLAAGKPLTAEYQLKLDESGDRIDAICKMTGITQDSKSTGRILNSWLSIAT